MQRLAIVLLVGGVVTTACGGKSTDGAKGGDPKAPTGEPPKAASLAVPKADAASTVAIGPDLATVFVAADGKLAIAASRTAKDRHDLDLRTLDQIEREAVGMGRPVAEMIADLGKPGDIDLATLEDTKNDSTNRDDPPPPEEDADESGGTGTAMALDEGKMGKKDSDRAEGSYQMGKLKKPPEPELGRLAFNKYPSGFGEDPKPGDAIDRNVHLGGLSLRKLGDKVPMYLAIDPKAKAAIVIDAIEASLGAILVDTNGETRVLRVQFFDGDRRYNDDLSLPRVIEVRATASGIDIEGVPSTPSKVPWNAKEIAEAYTTIHGTSKFAQAKIDVLVGDDVDAQHLIDLVVALDQAGAKAIALGKMWPKDHAQWALRGKSIHRARIGRDAVIGDLDQRLVHTSVVALQPDFDACFEKAPTTENVIDATYLIDAKGKIGSLKVIAKDDKIDAALITCFHAAFTKLKTPAPKSGGAVQVHSTIRLEQL